MIKKIENSYVEKRSDYIGYLRSAFFGLGAISFLQAWGIVVLVKLIFGGPHGFYGKHSGLWGNHHRFDKYHGSFGDKHKEFMKQKVKKWMDEEKSLDNDSLEV